MKTINVVADKHGVICLTKEELFKIAKDLRANAIDEFMQECRARTSHYLDGVPFKYMDELMIVANYVKEK